MTECRDLEPLLAPYADGETAPAERGRIEAHLADCPCCRGRLERLRIARDAVGARRDRIRGCAPEGLKARCAAHVRPVNATGAVQSGGAALKTPLVRPPLYRRWAPMTAAATILLAVTTVFAFGLNNKAHALAFQATIDHVKCARFHMAPRPADPVAAAEQWQARFGWPIKVPGSLAEQDLELRAVRRCAVTDGRVAHLIYMWKGEPLSLYVLPTDVAEEAPAFVRKLGHGSTIWSQNNRTYMLVSHRRDDTLAPVVAYVRAHVY